MCHDTHSITFLYSLTKSNISVKSWLVNGAGKMPISRPQWIAWFVTVKVVLVTFVYFVTWNEERQLTTNVPTSSDLSAVAASPEDSATTELASNSATCMLDSRISNDIKLRPGTKASNFTALGSADDIHRCIGRCCARPSCDIAYLLNGKCFAVQCLDGVLCQTSAEPVSEGANVKLAYMNRGSSGQKEKG